MMRGRGTYYLLGPQSFDSVLQATSTTVSSVALHAQVSEMDRNGSPNSTETSVRNGPEYAV